MPPFFFDFIYFYFSYRSNIRPEKANHNSHQFKMHTFERITSCSYCHLLLRSDSDTIRRCHQTYPNLVRIRSLKEHNDILYFSFCDFFSYKKKKEEKKFNLVLNLTDKIYWGPAEVNINILWYRLLNVAVSFMGLEGWRTSVSFHFSWQCDRSQKIPNVKVFLSWILLNMKYTLYISFCRGIFNQGYLCQKCGLGAHKECLGRLGVCGRTGKTETSWTFIWFDKGSTQNTLKEHLYMESCK